MRHIFQLSNYTISWIFSNFSGYLSNLPPSHFFKLHPPSIKHTVNHYDGEIVNILSDFSIKINLCISHDGTAKGGEWQLRFDRSSSGSHQMGIYTDAIETSFTTKNYYAYFPFYHSDLHHHSYSVD